jgi:hypothetical protein
VSAGSAGSFNHCRSLKRQVHGIESDVWAREVTRPASLSKSSKFPSSLPDSENFSGGRVGVNFDPLHS